MCSAFCTEFALPVWELLQTPIQSFAGPDPFSVANVSAISCIPELHFLSSVSSGKGIDVYRAFKTAVTLVSPGRGVAGSQGTLSSPCVRGPYFLLLAKVLHGIASKVLVWPQLQRFSTVSLSSCFIFENDSSKTEIPIQCHIRHGRFSLVERTMAWQSRGQPLFLVCLLTGCMALGKLLSPLCASAFPLTPRLSFSFRWLAPPGKECLLFVQFPVFCWRPWGLQPYNNRDSHQYYHLSLIYSSEEPNFHKGMNVPGPCVNSVQQRAIMTKNFSFWCVRAITSPGLRSGSCKCCCCWCWCHSHRSVTCPTCVGGPRVRCAQSAHALTTCWSSISASYAHDQALSYVASFGIVDSFCDLSVLLFGVRSSRKSYTWLKIQIYRNWVHIQYCPHSGLVGAMQYCACM